MTEATKLHGNIAIVGAPNVGKSSITNALLGQKLSIVSPKVQTTRNSIRGILMAENKQIILIDTPGIFIPREDKILERIIVKSAWQGLREANLVAFVIDAQIGADAENLKILQDLKKENLPIVVLINKIDLVKKSKLLDIINAFVNEGINEIFPISAKDNYGILELKNFFAKNCDCAGWIYDDDQLSDAPMAFIASEITREKLFLNLVKELPYAVSVKNDKYEVLNNGEIKIHQTIYVLKESQKSIILGKNGQMIKKIGQDSRVDIAEIAGAKVHLFLFVKVKEDWMRNIENFEKIDVDKVPNSQKKQGKIFKKPKS
ncbi:MAG: GTPase Era [Alphaproteobacteria bacterium]